MPTYTVSVALYRQIDDVRSEMLGVNRKYELEAMDKADELYYKFENRLKTQLQKIESKALPAGSVFNWVTLSSENTIIREAIYADQR